MIYLTFFSMVYSHDETIDNIANYKGVLVFLMRQYFLTVSLACKLLALDRWVTSAKARHFF